MALRESLDRLGKLVADNPVPSHDCAARRHPESMRCAPCGLSWDADDPEPPTCPRTGLIAGR